MAIFEYDGIKFNYKDDDNKGYPFVFLHGLGGDVNQTFGLLKQSNHIRRISIDFRGHGETIDFGDESKLSFMSFADDVNKLVDFLNIEEYALGGISTGAGVALNLALNYPKKITKLVLSRPAWLDEPQTAEIREAFSTIHDVLHDETAVDKKAVYKDTAIYQKMNSRALYAGSALLGQFDYKYAINTSQKLVNIPNDQPNSNRENWKEIDIPTLILASKQDPIHPYEYGEELYKYIKNSKFIELTPKEVSSEEHNKESNEAITEFLLRDF